MVKMSGITLHLWTRDELIGRLLLAVDALYLTIDLCYWLTVAVQSVSSCALIWLPEQLQLCFYIICHVFISFVMVSSGSVV